MKFLNELDRLSEAENSDSIEAPLNAAGLITGTSDINIAHLNLICYNTLEMLPALIGQYETEAVAQLFYCPHYMGLHCKTVEL